MKAATRNCLPLFIRYPRLKQVASTCVVILITALIAMPSPSACADELFALGGIVKSYTTRQNGTSYAWQLEFRKELSEHFLASLTCLNEGHVPKHHRDGIALQLWATHDILDHHISLTAGIGPYYYHDTIADAATGTYRNEHDFGCMASIAAVFRTGTPWLFQLHGNWVQTAGAMNTLSVLAGVGYLLDPPGRTKTAQQTQQHQNRTTSNEVTLFTGQTLINSTYSEQSTAVSIEYRKVLYQYLDWSLAWLHEGDSRLMKRYGVATQLWAVKAFLSDQLSLGFGAGVYVAFDQKAGHHQSGDLTTSGIGTLTASYHLDPYWSLRFSWNRVVTNYDRDSDILLGGIGYRF